MRRRLMLPVVIACAAVALLALLAFGVSHQGENTSLDAQVARGHRPLAPEADMALPVLGSTRTERLAQLRGQIVVVNLFASWCPPCKAEAPVLEQAQHQIAGHDATILGVTYADNASASAQFVAQEGITYPVLRDVTGAFKDGYGSNGIPETFVIDRQGRVAAVRRYQVTSQWLDQALAPLLAEHS